ncbi:protein of unknown function [Saccharopolyspora kobensis]|uniref:DUF4395 domain-containing protein n=1 Tax=Saccharopolyspora kobensis TaxID=146035 RepID=A0A1H6E1E9_9PSEU|nr:DUF4395 domain-containing protein [Saccharopolyspora kobensis]SEG91003.1 protein of unknown function [Saccharopolyspora kobensis]SFF13340.1 protein of unknown function [Saccharopolyspora kobensis]
MSAGTLDPRGVRFTAAITSAILALGLITASWRVMAAQMVLFGLCAFLGMRLNPWGFVYRQAVQPRLAPIDQAEREEPAPVRFSQGIGFAFALVATIGYAAGWTTLGLVANALALVAALLNAVFGYCLGCQLYLVLRRLAPAGASAPDPR